MLPASHWKPGRGRGSWRCADVSLGRVVIHAEKECMHTVQSSVTKRSHCLSPCQFYVITAIKAWWLFSLTKRKLKINRKTTLYVDVYIFFSTYFISLPFPPSKKTTSFCWTWNAHTPTERNLIGRPGLQHTRELTLQQDRTNGIICWNGFFCHLSTRKTRWRSGRETTFSRSSRGERK